MQDDFIRSSSRWDRREKTATWPVLAGAMIAVAAGAYWLSLDAYQLPLGETTTIQALIASLPALAIRLAPLALVAWAVLHFGILRRMAPGEPPLGSVLAAIVGAVLGCAVLVGMTALEKSEYETEARGLQGTVVDRIAADYDSSLMHSHRAFHNHVGGMFQFGVFRSRTGTAEDIQRARGRLEQARQAARNFEAAIDDNERRALVDVNRRAGLSRYGRAAATARLRALFEARRPLMERAIANNTAAIDEIEGQFDTLEASVGRWEIRYGAILFRNQADLNAFRVHSDRLREISDEAFDIQRQLAQLAAT